MTEKEADKDQICGDLRDLQYAMLGIYVSERNKHAVIYTGIKDCKFCMLNNKREQSDEPETLLLSEQELLQRVDETVTVGVLNKTAGETVKTKSVVKHSIAVLRSLEKEIAGFCSRERSSTDIRLSMNTLFRAILLEGITMLDLIGETQISQKLKIVQGQFMNAVKENKPMQLDQCLDMALLNSAITEYINLICRHA